MSVDSKANRYVQAFKLVPREDPKWLHVAWSQLMIPFYAQGRQIGRFREAAAKFAPHSLWVEFLERFTFKEFITPQIDIHSLINILHYPASFNLMVRGCE